MMRRCVDEIGSKPILEDRMTPLGTALRAARKAIRVSQTAAAQHAEVSRPAISATERKGRGPRAGELLKLASLFRLRPEELARGALPLRERPSATPAAAFRAKAGKKLDAQDENELRAFEEVLGAWSSEAALPALSDHLPVTIARSRVLQALGWEDEGPFDIFRALYQTGVMLEFTALGTISGALLRSGPRTCAVIVNSDQPDDRTRWSAAHEAAHILFNHALQESSHVDEYGPARGRDDKIADLLAGELLVPTARLLQVLDQVSSDHPNDQPSDTVCRLAHQFCVSYGAMAVRLGSAGVFTGEQVATLREVKPTEIERKLGLGTERAQPFVADDWVPGVAAELVRKQALPENWSTIFGVDAGPAVVRKLQSEAVKRYIHQVPLTERATSVTEVLEMVALWVANRYPLG
jgi:transcriptional regulator with XRE-family HTH domain